MVEALKALAAGGKNEQTGSVNYANLSRLGPFLARLDSRLGAVEDVAATEGEADLNVAEKRAEEAHDIIHRIAAILAMEEGRDDGGGGDGVLREKPWNGKFDGETIELNEEDDE